MRWCLAKVTTLATESTRNHGDQGLARVTLRHKLSRPVAKAPGSAVVLWCADANAGTWRVMAWFPVSWSPGLVSCIRGWFVVDLYTYNTYIYIYHICVCNCVYNYIILIVFVIILYCVWNYIILYYIILCYIILYYITKCYIRLYHILLYFIIYIILYQDIQICYACIVNL
jgi:hypothetical protein